MYMYALCSEHHHIVCPFSAWLSGLGNSIHCCLVVWAVDTSYCSILLISQCRCRAQLTQVLYINWSPHALQSSCQDTPLAFCLMELMASSMHGR